MMSLNAFSQNVTDSTKIQLTKPIAKLVIKDLIQFDGLSTERWGVTSSFHASGSGFTPDAFMATVVVGSGGALPSSAPTRYQAEGNIFTSASGDLYLYS